MAGLAVFGTLGYARTSLRAVSFAARWVSLTQTGQQPPGPRARVVRARAEDAHARHALRRLADRVPERAVVLEAEEGGGDLVALGARPRRQPPPAAEGG